MNISKPTTQRKRRDHKKKQETKMGVHRNLSISSPRKTTSSATLQSLLDIDYLPSKISSKSFSSSPRMKRHSSLESENEYILSIISHCCAVFTFTDPSESPTHQDFKRYKLIQLLSIIKSTYLPLPNQVLSSLVSMLSTNLFRCLPASGNCVTGAEIPDDEEPVSCFSLMWAHLEFIYHILLNLIINMKAKHLCNYINENFLASLLALFESDDPRERDCLKTVYHRIYLKFTFYRSYVRKSMTDVFLTYVFETEKHSGIRELLEIWGSIINGFTIPLKEEHKIFLMRVLIPLHKTKGMPIYHRQLAYCVNQFVQKEPVLGGIVVRGILKYWPITNCQKEILFIGEVEELVENIDPDQYRKLALPLCTQITRCFNSWNSQVAERALYIWNNEQFVKMASLALEDVLPIIVQGIEKNLKWHWSKSVKQLTENVKGMLQEMDPALYEKSVQDIIHKDYWNRREEKKRKKKWNRIEMEAAKNSQLLIVSQQQQ